MGKDQVVTELKNWYQIHQKKVFDRFFDFLRFPTVSAKKEQQPAFNQAVQFLKKELESIGFDVEIALTPFAPCLIATKIAHPTKKTALFYHHYDVQPEEPLELWESPPFEPSIRFGAVYARGAQDNKGQCWATLSAMRAFFELYPDAECNLKILIEGEEEIGSPHLIDLLKEKKEKLLADYLFVVDSGMKSLHAPVIGIGARGILSYELSLKSQAGDLHSGEHGGLVFSATKAMSLLLAKLFDDQGKVAIQGFYDDVKVPKLDPALYDVRFDLKEYQNEYRVRSFDLLEGISPIEANWLYPTLEINGVSGGYTGQGFKTVLPMQAQAKLSIRTVPNQDPIKITQALKEHIQNTIRPHIEWKLDVLSLGDYSVSDPDSAIVKIAKEAYTAVFDQPCLLARMGGSIPITAALAKASESEFVLIGTGLMSDQIHAPNEHFQLESFEKGFLTIGKILDILVKS